MSLKRTSKHPKVHLPPSGSSDRRRVCRYPVVLDEAWLGWWQGQAYESTPARIIDLSLHGARLTVDRFPPSGQRVWFCPPGVLAREDWIEVKLVGMKKQLFGGRGVRVAFLKHFPYEIFKKLVYGPDVYVPVEPPVWLPEESAERNWW